jgi:hypothetical protein
MTAGLGKHKIHTKPTNGPGKQQVSHGSRHVYRGALQPQPRAHPPEAAPAGRHFGGWREKRQGGAVGTRATPVHRAVPALSMHVT